MAKVNINGSEFDTDNMSDEAKNQLVMLQFTDAEIRRLEGQLAVYRTAKIAYSKALVEAFPILAIGGRDTIDFN
jgi:hypothetical protein